MAAHSRQRVETRELFRHLGETNRENERLKVEVATLRDQLERATADLIRTRAHATAILRLRG